MIPRGLAAGGRAAGWGGPGAVAAFFDVDGTTTEHEPAASPAVVAGFARAAAAGVRLGFATGRPPQGVAHLREQLGRPTGRTGGVGDLGDVVDVVHNGAAVVGRDGAVASWPLPRPAADALARWCAAEGVYAELYSGHRLFVTDRREAAHTSWDEVSGPPDGDSTDLLAGAGRALDVEKVTVNCFEVERTAEAVAVFEGLGLHVERSSAPFLPGVPVLNVTAPGVTKGAALRWWSERTGTPLARVLALGDGLNDLSMLELAGTGVAMGQAPERVRAGAHLVTASVEHDGAALVLEHLAAGAL